MPALPERADEVKISRHTGEEKIKQEFQDFTYIVSHDLNAPIRHVREFSKLLIHKLEDKIGTDERRYVTFIEDGLKEVDEMLNGLLEYSRISTRTSPFKEVDCNQLIQNLLQTSLKNAVEKSHAQIIFEGLPHAVADEIQLSMVFYHLLDNAIKFRSKDRPCEINIDVTEAKNQWVFSISDSGIGIPKEQHENVFNIFKRLHGKADYPGSGIGLALCKKIITRHGGNIWIDRNSSEGTKISFSLQQIQLG